MRIFFSTIFSLSILYVLATPTAGPGLVAFYDGSFEQMKAQAFQENKPYMLSFHDDGAPSRNLERFTYTNANLANYVAGNYLAMQFSIDELSPTAIKLMDRYQVILYPTIMLFSPEGKMLYRFTGFTGDQAFLKMLNAYRHKKETDMSQLYKPEAYTIIPSLPIEAKPAPKLSQGLSSPNQEEFEIGQLEDLDGFGLTDEKKETTPAKVEEEGEATPEESFIEDAPETPAVVSQSNIIVQTGVYSTWSNAQGEASRLERTYNTEAHIDQLEINGRTLYRVRIGPFDADAQATNFLKQYNQQEKDDAIIKTYER